MFYIVVAFVVNSVQYKEMFFFTFLSQPITLFPTYTLCKVPVLRPMDLMVEATPRRVFSNAHTYHINSISVNSDNETYMSTDDLRINLWNLEITNRSFSILMPFLHFTWRLESPVCFRLSSDN